MVSQVIHPGVGVVGSCGEGGQNLNARLSQRRGQLSAHKLSVRQRTGRQQIVRQNERLIAKGVFQLRRGPRTCAAHGRGKPHRGWLPQDGVGQRDVPRGRVGPKGRQPFAEPISARPNQVHFVLFQHAVGDVRGSDLVHRPGDFERRGHVQALQRRRGVEPEVPFGGVSPPRRLMRPSIEGIPRPRLVRGSVPTELVARIKRPVFQPAQHHSLLRNVERTLHIVRKRQRPPSTPKQPQPLRVDGLRLHAPREEFVVPQTVHSFLGGGVGQPGALRAYAAFRPISHNALRSNGRRSCNDFDREETLPDAGIPTQQRPRASQPRLVWGPLHLPRPGQGRF